MKMILVLLCCLVVCFACSKGSSSSSPAVTTGSGSNGGSGARGGTGGTTGGTGGPVVTQSGNPYYGSGVYMDELENLLIGPNGQVDSRFLCEHTATANRISLQYMNDMAHSGYTGGTGGVIQWQLCLDDGTGHPNQNGVLWTGTDTTPTRTAKNGSIIGSFTLPSVPLTAGQTYHILLTNIDPNPNTNFISLDTEAHSASTAFAQPFDPQYHLTAMYGGPNSWSLPGAQGVPDYSLFYDDGYIQGTGYCDTNGINGPAVETFTVSGGNKVVTALNVGGTGLSFVLAQGGNTVASASIGAGPIANWSTYVFSTPITLLNGTTYTLTVSGSLNRALQKGSVASSYIVPSFTDGYLSSAASVEYSLGNSYDMQFYFSMQ